MPVYVYRDKETGYTKEVIHSIKECDEPSEYTLEEITYEGRPMERVPTSFAYAQFAAMSPEKKKKVLMERADDDYKKNIHERKVEMNKNLMG